MWLSAAGANDARRVAALLLAAAVMTAQTATAQTSAMTNSNRNAKSTGSKARDSKLDVSAAEMSLLGGPSEVDDSYLKHMGGPVENATTPSASLNEEPATPTEMLLTKTGMPETKANDDASRLTHRMPVSSSADPVARADLMARNPFAQTYASPFGGNVVYRSPW